RIRLEPRRDRARGTVAAGRRRRRRTPGPEDADEPAAERLEALAFAHEPLARRADERDRLGEEDPHRVAEGERLLVRTALRLDTRERRRGQLDRGVQGQG